MRKLIKQSCLSGEVGKAIHSKVEEIEFKLREGNIKNGGVIFQVYVSFSSSHSPICTIYLDILRGLKGS